MKFQISDIMNYYYQLYTFAVCSSSLASTPDLSTTDPDRNIYDWIVNKNLLFTLLLHQQKVPRSQQVASYRVFYSDEAIMVI